MHPDDLRARVTRAAWSVFAAYAAAGFAIGTLASRLPAVRSGLGVTSAQMGLILLLWSLGSVLALPLSGAIAARFGIRRCAAGAAVAAGLGHLTLGLAVALGSAPLAVAGLFGAGMGEGVWNASISVQGTAVERRLGYPAMPRFQAGESLGMVAGSLVGALVAATGLPLLAHLGFTATVVIATGVLAARTFVPMPSSRVDHRTGDRGAQSASRGSAARSALAAWREPRTLLLGLGILGAALAEGSASDWTGIALVSGFGTPESIAGAGVTLFYASMLVARLLGTTLVLRLGRVTTLRLGAGGVLVGLALFVFSPWLPLAMAGSVIWGMGAALGFPVGLSAASDDPQRAAMRVSVVSTIGYTAYVIGPGVIGVVAGHLGYRGALLVVAAPVVLAMVAARAARPLPTTARHRPGTDAERDDADAREPVLVGTA